MSILLTAAALALCTSEPARPSPTPEDVPGLIAKMKASYDTKSWSAVYAFGRIGRPAVPALIEVLRDRTLPSHSNVSQPARYQAAFALAQIGPPAADAVPTLLTTLGDRSEDEGVRWAAASALGSIGHQPNEVVPALVAVLEEPSSFGSSLSGYAVGALAQLASQQTAALPALRRALPALKRAHGRMGGSGGFAMIFRVLEPPSPKRMAEEEDIREVVLRRELKDAKETWCIGPSVSAELFKRLATLKVTRDTSECSRKGYPPSPDANSIVPLYRALDVEAIDWLSNDRVHTSTTACFGFIPCFTTIYTLEHRKGRWIVVSEDHPLAL